MDRAPRGEVISNGCQFLTFDDPIRAVISDKTTSITATIASAAAEQFRRKYYKRITENTRGCLIQLLQFEIVATHHGPPDDRLTLRIQELHHIGCDGEGTFGIPRPIIKQDGIRQFLSELKAFRVRAPAKRVEDRNGDEEDFMQTQESTREIEGRESDVVNSQSAFATQHRSHTSASAKALSRSTLGRGQMQKPEAFVTAEDTTSQTSCISSEEVEQNILDILEEAKAAKRNNPPASAIASSVEPRDSRGKPLNYSEFLALLNKKSWNGVIRPVVLEEDAQKNMSNESAVFPNLSKEHGSPKMQAAKSTDVASVIEHVGNSDQSALRKSPILHDAQENAKNEDKQLDTPTTLPQNMTANTDGLQSHSIASQNVDRPSLPLPLAGAFCKEDIEDPWHGMFHINRRDVTIPKNQQILLDRKDCWLPAEPGSRGPVANVPVPILQMFTTSIEGHMDIASDSTVTRQDDSDSDSVSESAEISMPHIDAVGPLNITHEDIDLPISTAEWPPSSPPLLPLFNELPPDSSLEVTTVHDGDGLKLTDEPQNPGELQSVHSDEEVSCHQLTPHSRPRYNDHDGMLVDTTENYSNVPEEMTILKDTEFGYSSSSELETSVPNALCEGQATTNMKLQRSTPVDITDSRKSTLQVHRTPYTNQDYRVKARIMSKSSMAEKSLKRHQETKELIRHNDMSYDDSVTEDIIPGTYSPLKSAQELLPDHSHICLTENAEESAPSFHGGWVPYSGEEASRGLRKNNANGHAQDDAADLDRITRRGTEEYSIKYSNITKRRKRTKLPEVIMIEDDQQRKYSATKFRQLSQEVLNDTNIQYPASTAIPDEVLNGGGKIPLDDTPAEPVLSQFTHSNRGLSANQGIKEAKTTCTQTPEATSSRSGTPWRDVRVIELDKNLQSMGESASPVQNMPDTLSSHLAKGSVFSSFQLAYPSYEGTEKHFAAMCRKILTLETNHRMEHKSLWDDFIVRHKLEYRAYLHECSEQADDPMPYESFYHAKIDEPLFSKQIVTPHNLHEAIDTNRPQATVGNQGTTASHMEISNTHDSASRNISRFGHSTSAQHTPSLWHSSPLQHDSHLQRKSPSEPQLPLKQSTPTPPAAQQAPIPGTPRTAEKTPRSLPWKRKITERPSPSGRPTKRRNVSTGGAISPEPHQIQRSAYAPTWNATASRLTYPATATAPIPKTPAAMPSPSKSSEAPNPSMQRHTRKGPYAPSTATIQPLTARTTAASPRTTTQFTAAKPIPLKSRDAPAQPWYLDPVNPFKDFARADAAIRSGNGNAFAAAKYKQRAQEVKAEMANGVVLAQMRGVDVLAWEL